MNPKKMPKVSIVPLMIKMEHPELMPFHINLMINICKGNTKIEEYTTKWDRFITKLSNAFQFANPPVINDEKTGLRTHAFRPSVDETLVISDLVNYRVKELELFQTVSITQDVYTHIVSISYNGHFFNLLRVIDHLKNFIHSFKCLSFKVEHPSEDIVTRERGKRVEQCIRSKVIEDPNILYEYLNPTNNGICDIANIYDVATKLPNVFHSYNGFNLPSSIKSHYVKDFVIGNKYRSTDPETAIGFILSVKNTPRTLEWHHVMNNLLIKLNTDIEETSEIKANAENRGGLEYIEWVSVKTDDGYCLFELRPTDDHYELSINAYGHVTFLFTISKILRRLIREAIKTDFRMINNWRDDRWFNNHRVLKFITGEKPHVEFL